MIHSYCVSSLLDHVDIVRREDAQNGLMTICKVHSLQLSLPLSSCHLGVKNAGSEKLLSVCEKSLVSARVSPTSSGLTALAQT